MSRPIKLTPELRRQAMEEFSKTLDETKMTEGRVGFSKTFTYKNEDKAKILFTPTAYAKMVSLLMAFDSEVAWHGVGERLNINTFVISDIVVYPQTVTGSTVDMDTEKYATWLMENDEDDRFNHIIMQGHSHVKMATSPSSVDKEHQEEILAQLTDDMYYIFMIWNKRLEHTTKIYDLVNNTMYDNKDIEYGIIDDLCDIDSFLKEAKEIVVERTYATINSADYGDYGNYYYGNSEYAKLTSHTQAKQENNAQKYKAKSGTNNRKNKSDSESDIDSVYSYYEGQQNFFDK